MSKTNTGGKGGRKYGRNSKSCLTYFNNGTRMKNKIRKVKRHLRDLDKRIKRLAKRKVPPMKNGKQIKLQRDRQAENWLKANT